MARPNPGIYERPYGGPLLQVNRISDSHVFCRIAGGHARKRHSRLGYQLLIGSTNGYLYKIGELG